MLNIRSSYVKTKEILYTLIHRYQPVARSDLADISGLTRASVSNIVKEFLQLGLVQESDKKGVGIGRKKVLLKINPKSIHVIGVDIGRRNIVATVYNAGGKILRTERLFSPSIKTLHESVEDVKRILSRILTWTHSKEIHIDAIGIGIPGPVDPEKGIVHSAHFRGNEIVNLKESIEISCKIPTFVEKDVNAAALGEQWFGDGKKHDSFVYLLVVEGIGAGMIIDGHLYRGVHDLAGKVGRFVFPAIEENGKRIFIFEEFGSEISALKFAEENAIKSKNGYLYTTMQKRQLSIGDLIDGFREKDPAAIEAVDSMAYYTAITVANLVFFADPDLIVIGGDFAGISPRFIQQVREEVETILNGHPLPELRASPIHDISISLGAATRAISEVASKKLS
ncbi:MAG: hypothetical protein DRP50_03585 [Thermotoga sp.]|nr:ROK family transcriptional regulator [Thermotogota bacterium]RKX54983.1 MAG: hypothetical protein DRP50_03585 [Thermotoga sp.]